MKYLCTVIGNGTSENPYRPIVADIIGISWSWQIDTDMPLNTQILTDIYMEDYTILENIVGVVPYKDN